MEGVKNIGDRDRENMHPAKVADSYRADVSYHTDDLVVCLLFLSEKFSSEGNQGEKKEARGYVASYLIIHPCTPYVLIYPDGPNKLDHLSGIRSTEV